MMRWMKHLTSAHTDEKIAALICEDGLEAYGFYWLLCEVIASTMDGSDRCELTYPLPHWSRVLYSHHHRVSKYLGKLEVRGLCEISNGGGNLTVRIPKLLKYRDEYSRKSGQSQEKVGSDAGPKIERQKEIEKENKNPSDSSGERQLTEQQKILQRIETEWKSRSSKAMDFGFLARLVSLYGEKTVKAKVIELGDDGHLEKGTAYLRAALSEKRSVPKSSGRHSQYASKK